MTDAMPRTKPGEVLVSLQYLRAVAALMVVWFHAAFQVAKLSGGAVAVPAIGASGVDIFFVLSGFVMVVSTRGRTTDPIDFLKRRLARIAPLYWLLTLLAAFVAFVVPQLLRSTVYDTAHLAASLAFVPWRNPAMLDPANPSAITPVIVPGWTLNFEMMFYVLFALSLLVPGERRRLPVLTGLVALFYGICLLLQARTWFGFYASPIMFEFVAGAWLASVLAGRAGAGRAGGGSPAVPLAGLAAGFLALIGVEALFGELFRWLLLGIPAFVIVWCAVLAERARAVRSSPLLNELGNASYSIYLSHVFVLAGLRVVMAMAHLAMTPLTAALFMVAALLCSAAAGFGLHALVEKPVTRIANAALRGSRGRRDLPVSIA